MEVVTFAVTPKLGVYQMDKIKEKWKELGKILGEGGNVRAVKQKSEHKD